MMGMEKVIFQLLLIGSSIIYAQELSNSKRILLSDSTYVEHELNLLKAAVHDLQTKLTDVTTKYNELKAVNPHTNGTLYVTWGRKLCPTDNSTLIYSGMVGGGGYGNTGSAVEPVCLPHDPLFGIKSVTTYYDVMYGSEYVDDNFFGPKSADEDVPCAVCNREGASQYLMIPGRNECYKGWQKEYSGYLGSNYYANKRGSKYACIHENPEFLEGGNANDDGYVFHSVVTACGSLKCPPYENHKPVTCVVCTR